MRSARGKEISLTAVSDKGAALDLRAFFTRKGSAKNLLLFLLLKLCTTSAENKKSPENSGESFV